MHALLPTAIPSTAQARGRAWSAAAPLQPSIHLSPPLCARSQVLPKREGLLHVSEWGPSRVNNVADVVKEGDTVDVMVTEVQVSTRAQFACLPC